MKEPRRPNTFNQTFFNFKNNFYNYRLDTYGRSTFNSFDIRKQGKTKKNNAHLNTFSAFFEVFANNLTQKFLERSG